MAHNTFAPLFSGRCWWRLTSRSLSNNPKEFFRSCLAISPVVLKDALKALFCKKIIIFGKKLSKNVIFCKHLWVPCNITFLPLLFALLWMKPVFPIFSRRRKTPSLLFVHNEAFFIRREETSFLSFRSQRSILEQKHPLVVCMQWMHHGAMKLKMSNECLDGCKVWCDEVCTYRETLHPLRNDFGVFSPFT
jgi:hypothetical protein